MFGLVSKARYEEVVEKLNKSEALNVELKSELYIASKKVDIY